MPDTARRRTAAAASVVLLTVLVGVTPASAEAAPAAGRPYTFVREFTAFAGVQNPNAMAISGSGRVYVIGTNPGSDPGSRVRVFTTNGRLVDTWDVDFDNIGGMDVDRAGNLHIGDYSGRSFPDEVPAAVHVYAPDGRLLGEYARTDDESPTVGDVAIARDGTRYTVDPVDNVLSQYSPAGVYVGSLGGAGSSAGRFDSPFGVEVDDRGNVYVADLGNDRIQVFAPNGRFLRQFGQVGTRPGQLFSPREVRIAPNGHLFVTDSTNRVQEFTTKGRFVRVAAAARLRQNFDLAFDRGGRLYVAGYLDSLDRGVAVFAPPRPPRASLVGRRLDAARGRVGVRVRCVSSTACRGRVTLVRGRAVLAVGALRVPAGKTRQTSIRLTPKGKQALRRAPRIRAVVRLSPRGGKQSTFRVVLSR